MKISIITPYIGSIKEIKAALESVENQTHPPFEHLLIDGGACGETKNIIASHARPWRHEIRSPVFGLYESVNFGISMAKGDVIGILAADDMYETPDVLRQVASALENPQYGIVYGGMLIVSRSVPRGYCGTGRPRRTSPELSPRAGFRRTRLFLSAVRCTSNTACMTRVFASLPIMNCNSACLKNTGCRRFMCRRSLSASALAGSATPRRPAVWRETANASGPCACMA